MPEKFLFHGRFNIIASLNVQTISLLEANIIVNLLLGTDKIMLQRYKIYSYQQLKILSNNRTLL